MAFLDETGLAELWALVKAEDTKLAQADVKVAAGTYTGTGKYGSANQCKLNLGFQPQYVQIATVAKFPLSGNRGSDLWYWYQVSSVSSTSSQTCVTTWGTNSVAWYHTSGASQQFNESGKTYYYLAIG